ncbi:50S ribosomal protein L31 [Immundisolibacter sp.]|uniref:50S ribosomal protein L31 n=1 Tax=Immundisolibacter sp. TaxID=1934948 RepID=UPI00356B0235
MKSDIHPKYQEIAVTCSCGNSFTTRSAMTKPELHLDVCSSCHPFYTGKQKVGDRRGRVERFKRRYGMA